PRRRGPAAAAEAWRELRVHQRHASRDGGGHHARHLSNGRRGWAALRRADSSVYTFGAPHPALVLLVVACYVTTCRWRCPPLRRLFALSAHREPHDEHYKQQCDHQL